MKSSTRLTITWAKVIFKNTLGQWSAAYNYASKFYHFIKVVERKFRTKLLIAHGFAILAKLIFLGGSLAIVPFVNYVINPESIHKVKFLDDFYKFSVENIPIDFVVVLGISSVALMILARLFFVLGNYISQLMHMQLNVYFTSKLYYSYIHGIFHSTGESTAEIVNNINSRLPQVINNFINPIFSLVNLFFFVSSGLLILFFLNSTLLLLAIGGGSVFLFGAIAATQKRARQYSVTMDVDALDLNRKLLNSISAREYIQMIGKQNVFAKNYARVQQKLGMTGIKMNLINMLFAPIGEIVIYGTMVSFAIYIFIVAGQDKLDIATAFLIIIYRLFPALVEAFGIYIGLQRGVVSYNKVSHQLLKAMATKTSYDRYVRNPLPFKKSLEIKKASYKYPSQEPGELALANISLKIAKGSKIGICGVSGGGKTTLLRLLTTRAVPDKGSFFVDGEEIINHKLIRRWQDTIGYVTQNLILVEGTIAENITLSFGDGVDEAMLQKAIDIAELRSLVNDMPQQEHSDITDSGANISGGQRQRIVIARALYLNPDLLIFDEATSSLDKRTETKILKNVYNFYEERDVAGTMIIVSHRVDALQNCDNIVMVENGEIVAQGKYKDLLKLPSFRTLAQSG
ncbi:MAG: ABC transporter ATP-binding protein/permease [Gammaproteobacteria bacterium]|nr:ABC transporter ATP-binding protein/permease [Gammaproteobacteria bacterium]